MQILSCRICNKKMFSKLPISPTYLIKIWPQKMSDTVNYLALGRPSESCDINCQSKSRLTFHFCQIKHRSGQFISPPKISDFSSSPPLNFSTPFSFLMSCLRASQLPSLQASHPPTLSPSALLIFCSSYLLTLSLSPSVLCYHAPYLASFPA